MFGGRSAETTVASATTTLIPDNASWVYITGTATITTLLPSDQVGVNRLVVFCASGTGASVTFTNTNTPVTAGQMYLKGSNRTIVEGETLWLYFKADRTWQIAITP